LKFQISQFFDKISDRYNKTTQKVSNFFENHRQVKLKKKDVKNTKKLKKQIVNDGIMKYFVFKVSLFFLIKIEEFSRIL